MAFANSVTPRPKEHTTENTFLKQNYFVPYRECKTDHHDKINSLVTFKEAGIVSRHRVARVSLEKCTTLPSVIKKSA